MTKRYGLWQNFCTMNTIPQNGEHPSELKMSKKCKTLSSRRNLTSACLQQTPAWFVGCYQPFPPRSSFSVSNRASVVVDRTWTREPVVFCKRTLGQWELSRSARVAACWFIGRLCGICWGIGEGSRPEVKVVVMVFAAIWGGERRLSRLGRVAANCDITWSKPPKISRFF
jgi:hypothetical protein